ncbi:Predicted transcriptional regulator, containsd two HTH domains [Methanolobus vulcani]|uniref:Predicted transcriptional regulator, containsd two HTH domains n=1 Tax=Methanolobus vulcani TaxID=38026 RepID=A0A7Z7FD41_9EURY|nr:winged helix-turn-helix transcriptional regulator [Methanolobus vulcani]SDF22635.1 Predicted transcriptional regulator, containsd two HTH domains [Methanolobus vulcani]
MNKIFLLFIILLFFVPYCYGNDNSVVFHNVTSESSVSYGSQEIISFWDLSFKLKIVALGFIIMGLGWKIVALLTAWAKKDPNNENRQRILNFIKKNPGSTVNMIESDLGIKRGTVRYHVINLKDAGKILMFRNGNYVSLFRNESALWNKNHKRIEPHLPGATCKKVCRMIYDHPGITNMELCEKLGLSKGAVTSHIKTLEDIECLEVETSGKFKNYFLREGYHPDELPLFERIR